MKNMSRDEFHEYVENLKFYNIADAAAFVSAYYDDYEKTPSENEDERRLAYEKYIILIAKYGILFVDYATITSRLVESIFDKEEKTVQ